MSQRGCPFENPESNNDCIYPLGEAVVIRKFKVTYSTIKTVEEKM